jgi:hypothetical protein
MKFVPVKYLWLSSLIAFFCAADYIAVFGVNIPLLDDWELVPFIDKFHTHRMSLPDLWAQHNEHRIAFSRLLFLLLCDATKFNTTIFMHVVLACLCGVYLMVYSNIKLNFMTPRKTIPIWTLIVPFIVFNLRQYENLLWGFQMGFGMVTVFSVLALFSLDRACREYPREKHPIYFAAAVMSAFFASYSSIAGLFAWIAGILIITGHAAAPPKKISLPALLAWSASGAITWILYFNGYQRPAAHADPMLQLRDPVTCIMNFLFGLGCGLTGEPISATLCGLLIVAVFLAGCRALLLKKDTTNVFWLACILFAFLFCGSIVLGRGFLGREALASSRYVTFFVAGYASVLAIIFFPKRQPKQWLSTIVLIAAAAGILNAGIEGFKQGLLRRPLLKEVGAAIISDKATDHELQVVFPPSAQLARERIKLLKKYHYNLFATSRKIPSVPGMKNSPDSVHIRK